MTQPPLPLTAYQEHALEPLSDYPRQAGWKAPGTSAAAAASVDAAALRVRVQAVLARLGPLTADEVAEALKPPGMKVEEFRLSIRPRCSELRLAGRIVDTGLRRRNRSGHMAAVWRLAQDGGA